MGGCGNRKDRLSHYTRRPHLFAFLSFFFEGFPSDPLIRIGLKSPDPKLFKVLACTFSAYHALKAKVRAGRIQMHEDSETKVSLRHAWSVFADVLGTEAGERKLPYRAFSLPKFIHFLNSGNLQQSEDGPASQDVPDVICYG